MNKLLTISIPTYNMEGYIKQCLESLMISDYSLLANVEILVINDGSSDNSSSVAKSYIYGNQSSHNTFPEGVLRVIDKSNGNYGSCINCALKEAKGKYIKVLDADDTFDTLYFSKFLSKLQALDADLIVNDYCEVDTDDRVNIYRAPKLPLNKYFSPCDINTDVRLSMHNMTYRTDLLREINYSQSEGISYSDSEWTLIPLMHVKTIHYLNIPLYRYLVGREGQTVNSSETVKKYPDFIHTTQKILSHSKKPNSCLTPHIKDLLTKLAAIPYEVALIRGDGKCDTAPLQEFDKVLRTEHIDIYNSLDNVSIAYGHIENKYIHRWRNSLHCNLFGFTLTPFRYRILNRLICMIPETVKIIFIIYSSFASAQLVRL